MAERKGSSTQRKYKSETITKNDAPPAENEIRIRRDGPTGGYINRAAELFLRAENPHRLVTISAIGQAIPIALAVSEKIREKIAGLHAIQSIQSIEKTILFKPQEQGLDEVTQTRFNAAFRIVLSLDASPQDLKSVGYSAPRPGVTTATLDEIKAFRTNRAPRPYNNGGNQGYPR